MFLVFHFFVVIPGHNLGNSQVSVYRTIGPTLVIHLNNGYNVGWFMWLIFSIFFFFDVAIFDLVHDMEAIFPLPAYGKFFET